MPPVGKGAATVMALLLHSHENCSGMARRLETFWQQLSANPNEVQESLDLYVLTRATADLAGARKALDLAWIVLAQSETKIDPTSREALKNRYEAESALCQLVALPNPPLEDFQAKLAAREEQIKLAEHMLGSLIEIPDRKRIHEDIQPYMKLIQEAESEARVQMRKEIDILRPRNSLPTRVDEMKKWHRRYEEAVEPAKAALRAYRAAREGSEAAAVQLACREIQDTVIPLLNLNASIFNAPDPHIRQPLESVYKAMRRLANRCTVGRFSEVEKAYEWLTENLSSAAEVLAPYALEP